jgi:hypothetical protein
MVWLWQSRRGLASSCPCFPAWSIHRETLSLGQPAWHSGNYSSWRSFPLRVATFRRRCAPAWSPRPKPMLSSLSTLMVISKQSMQRVLSLPISGHFAQTLQEPRIRSRRLCSALLSILTCEGKRLLLLLFLAFLCHSARSIKDD